MGKTISIISFCASRVNVLGLLLYLKQGSLRVNLLGQKTETIFISHFSISSCYITCPLKYQNPFHEIEIARSHS